MGGDSHNHNSHKAVRLNRYRNAVRVCDGDVYDPSGHDAPTGRDVPSGHGDPNGHAVLLPAPNCRFLLNPAVARQEQNLA